jgi:hypothetical protein
MRRTRKSRLGAENGENDLGPLCVALQATNTKKEEERNKEMEKRAKWSMCAATGEPLGKDMLADDLGYIFNRESILKYGHACPPSLTPALTRTHTYARTRTRTVASS